jgi:hypothetical protein
VARIRTIKPGFFRSEDVSALPLRARLTWIGLWTQCDDQGRTKDNAKLIKADVWPLDPVSLTDIEEDLITLADHGRIVRYEVDGKRFLAVVNWDEHQTINRPTLSRIPAPSLNGHVSLTADSVSPPARKGKEGKGREGNARERASPPDPPTDEEPPTRCDKHARTTKPPACGGCADARKAHNRWEVDRSKRLANAPRCVVHETELADNCRLCRSEELAPP